MPHRLLPSILAAATLLASSGADAAPTSDTADVPTLIAAYHQAVLGHDGARLARLFLQQGTAWVSVLSEGAWTRIRSARPDVPKVRPGTVAAFVQMVSTSGASLDPQHDNLRITSDGEIAAVTFDFRFMIDGREENRGAESWQLIRTAEGWRIVSIVFSSTPASTR